MNWRSIWHRKRRAAEIVQEIEAHIAHDAEDMMARGMPPDQTMLLARRRLGNQTTLREAVHEMGTPAALQGLWRDTRHSARLLRLEPWFAMAAVLSLALGIGANSAIFGLLNAIRLRSLPVPNAGELVSLRVEGDGRVGRQTGRNRQVSWPLWQEIAKHQQSFSALAAFGDTRFNVAPQGEVRYVEGLWVSGSFFSTLGVQSAMGRVFTSEEDRPGCGYFGAVVSHAFWQRELGGRADAIGQPLTIGPDRVPVIGVTPEQFFGVEVGRRFDVALPVCSAAFGARNHFWLGVIGRSKPGWTAERVNAHLQALSPAVMAETLPAEYRPDGAKRYLAMRVHAVPASSGVSRLRGSSQDSLLVLLGIAGLVLLLAAANLANLMLARATARQQEFALRLSLGASRWQVVRQVLVEGLMLAAIGSAIGLWVATWASALLVRMISTGLDPIYLDLSLDWRLVAFTAAITAITCLLFSAAPALRVTRMAEGIRSGVRGMTASRERFAFRRVLVALQIAMSFVLLFGALLFSRSFQKLVSVDAGFQREGILTANLFFRAADLPAGRRAAFYRELTEKLSGIPEVQAVSYASSPPLSGAFWDTVIAIRGEARGQSNVNQVGAGYFTAMGTTLLAGRDFGSQDTASSPKVAVIGETFARRFFGKADPLGQIFAMPGGSGQPDTEYQVVGLVKDTKYYNIREEFAPLVFIAGSQEPNPGLTRRYVVRTNGAEGPVMASIRRVVAEASPGASLRFAVLQTLVMESLLSERLMATLASLFGGIAVLLAVVGLYGVLSYIVAKRQNEIGIRMALGADRASILCMMLREVVILLSIGLAAGVGIALLCARAAKTLLFGLEWYDPGMLALTTVAICASGLAAASWPTVRAAAVEPSQALREY